ncbi:uncharacterized protein PAC_15208 [Phialocephala subalpina]|uniref:Spore coat protein SP96 n=1 Tax=Phialocephala subalpina TaxID=576137 RepID=A0A1L7XJW8_9HELO|nr:uncharacterized protein PAC_15208 [Phialocephala subalpina]
MFWHSGLYLVVLPCVASHLFVGVPPPLRAHDDISLLITPLNGDPNSGIGQLPFPCKGFQVDLDGSGGMPVADWTSGQDVTFSYVSSASMHAFADQTPSLFDSTNTTGATMHNPGAAHSGGSCQVAFSYDRGETWVVVHSWEGNCPRVNTPGSVTNVYDINQDYTFTVPADFPSGQRVLFGWVWINASGNRELYMSCSSVNIQGAGSVTTQTPAGPPLFVANLNPINNDCVTKENTAIIYPSKFIENTVVDVAPAPVDIVPAVVLQDFSATNPASCGSDNSTLVGLLKDPSN